MNETTPESPFGELLPVRLFEEPAYESADDKPQHCAEENVRREMDEEIHAAEAYKRGKNERGDPRFLMEPEDRRGGREGEHAVHGRAGEGRRPADDEGDGFVNRARPLPRDPVLQETVTDVIRDDIGG